ncbi:MAG TPA: glycosyltransferase [Gammaproteobacteria bacterium]
MVTNATVTPLYRATTDSVEERASGGDGERVLYVVSSFPCWSETFIVREINALLRRGVNVRIVSLRHMTRDFVQSDARLLLNRVLYPKAWHRNLGRVLSRFRTQPLATLAPPLAIVRRLWRKPYVMAKSLVAWFRALGVLDEIEAWSPDHVHAHWATYPSTAAMAISRHIRRPFSFTAHAHDIFLDDQLMREKLASAAFVATISRFNREYLRRRYPHANDARIEIVHCGVPQGERQERHRGGDSREPLIVSVGRLDDVKGFPSLLDACAALKRQGMNFRCEIIGEGPRRKRLEEQIDALGLGDCIDMSGARPSQEVERRLAQADVFVLASQRSREGNMDGIPVALMEAMASRTPVVSTAVSGIPELVADGETGLLVPPRDPQALAAAIRRVLEDEALRKRCVEGAVKKVRNEFDAETEGERLLGVIRSLKGKAHAEAIADHN